MTLNLQKISYDPHMHTTPTQGTVVAAVTTTLQDNHISYMCTTLIIVPAHEQSIVNCGVGGDTITVQLDRLIPDLVALLFLMIATVLHARE